MGIAVHTAAAKAVADAPSSSMQTVDIDGTTVKVAANLPPAEAEAIARNILAQNEARKTARKQSRKPSAVTHGTLNLKTGEIKMNATAAPAKPKAAAKPKATPKSKTAPKAKAAPKPKVDRTPLAVFNARLAAAPKAGAQERMQTALSTTLATDVSAMIDAAANAKGPKAKGAAASALFAALLVVYRDTMQG